MDPEARITFANDHFLELTGWREEEVMGRDWFDRFIPESSRADVRGIFRKVMTQEAVVAFSNYENEIITKSGELRNVAWSNMLTKNSKGDVVDVTCLGVDITEIRQAEEALRKSEERLRMIAENTGSMIAILDHQGIYEFVNPAHRVRGYEPEELVGVSGFTLIHPEDRRHLAETLQKGLKGEISRVTIAYRAKHRDGGTRFVEGTFDSIWNHQGQLEKIVFVGDDITQRKALEEKLLEGHKLKSVGQLAGGVAHDFNNMLAIIIANIEMAAM